MRDENAIVRDRQLVIRRELDRRGLSLKAIAFDSGLPYSSILSYFPGEKDKEPHTISGAALYALCAGKALPLDLLSMVLPDGCQIVFAPDGVDHDELARLALDLATEHAAARHPLSEAGTAISPNEHNRLTAKATHLRAVAA